MTRRHERWPLTRRQFAVLPAGLVGRGLTMQRSAQPAGRSQNAPLTAGQVIDRIKEHLGVPWRGGATDTFKAGDADSPVRGIATSVMSTFDPRAPRAAGHGAGRLARLSVGTVAGDGRRQHCGPDDGRYAPDVEQRLRIPVDRTSSKCASASRSDDPGASATRDGAAAVLPSRANNANGRRRSFDANAGERKGMIWSATGFRAGAAAASDRSS